MKTQDHKSGLSAARIGKSDMTSGWRFHWSVHSRVRFLLLALGGLALCVVFASLLRSERFEASSAKIQLLSSLQSTCTAAIQDTEEIRIALWRVRALPTADTKRTLNSAALELSRSLLGFERGERALDDVDNAIFAEKVVDGNESAAPVDFASDNALELSSAWSYARELFNVRERLTQTITPLVDPRLENIDGAMLEQALAVSVTILDKLRSDNKILREALGTELEHNQEQAERVTRLLLMFTLLLGCLLVAALYIGPAWVSEPLEQLRLVAQRIESGRIGDLRITGDDEVSAVVRALQASLLKGASRDRLRTQKLLELRKLVRATMNSDQSPIIIVSARGKVEYVNDACCTMFNVAAHKIEGHIFLEVFGGEAFENYASSLENDHFAGGITFDERGLNYEVSRRRIDDIEGKLSRWIYALRPAKEKV